MRRSLVMLLALGAGALALPAPAAAAPVTITSGGLSVRVDSAFPRVIDYTLGSNVLYGQEDTLTQVVLNGTTYTPTVSSTPFADHVDYSMSFSNGATVGATISVAAGAMTFRVTSVSSAVTTLAIPSHNLVSVRSTQGSASVATTKMHTATTGTGDTFTAVTASTAVDSTPAGAMYAIANTGQLAAAIATNSYYDEPSGGNVNEQGRIRKQVVDKGSYRRAGLWSGDWLLKASGATETEPLPFAKVVVTADRNADAVVDWQDGAIAFRDIMSNPQGWQDTKRRVVQRIPFNFASQATHPYEGWQGKKDFTAFLNTTFAVNLPTKYLQGFTIRRWTSNQIDFEGGVSAGPGTISKDGHLIRNGSTYLLPWENESKLYHWNNAGGATTWGIPTSWGSPPTVKLYRLTDTGRVFVSDLTVASGQVTINATAKTPYVVYPATAPSQGAPNWGAGGVVKNPGFFGGTGDWTVAGAASVTRNALGQSQLVMGAGASSVTQTLALSPGTYAASVYVATSGGRKATLTAGGQSVFTTSSSFTNNVGGDEKNGTSMQRMRVLFDVSGSSATLSLQADAGSATITFDDVRVVRTTRSPQGSHYFAEDFENIDQGWVPFVVGSAGGSATDPRTHIAQRHAPFTQKGWNGKLIDDVLTGANSLKAHEERQGLIYRTLPQTLRFTPGREYRVTFNYQQSVGGDYGFVIGAGASEVSTDNLAQARSTTSFTKTFTAGTEAWIGTRKLTAETSNQDRDLVIDDLTVDDLGAGTPGGSRLPQAQLSVRAYDSQETVGESAPATNVLDGNSSTIWHTQWSGTTAPMPHFIELDLGGTYQVTNLYYLPRQSQANGRIAQYEVQTSTDGSTWASAATGTFPNSTAEQTVSFSAKTGRYVRLRALSEVNGNPWTSVAELNVGVADRIPQAGMTVTFVDSADDATGGQGANVLDGDPATIWHTAWSGVEPDPVPPHEIRVDLGASYAVRCVYALPRQTGANGRIAQYEIYVSADGSNWGTAVATGTWVNAASEQSACFTAKTGRYVRLRALSEVNGGAWTSLAELNVSG